MDFLKKLGIKIENPGASCGDGKWLPSSDSSHLIISEDPATGKAIASVQGITLKEYEQVIQNAKQRFDAWRQVPAPKRGELIRIIGERLREHKDSLGSLVAYEMGKSKQEGDGEVQEMIDMADLAVGLSRMLYGLTMHSERPMHRMYEQWHPLGVVGVITAFNFPVAVWAWNAFIAAVCGNTVVWKPSSKVPLCA
ncbi:MAG TPA: aldehyde dehydrogenase family protein, partial [Candidatus Berkiella sp.]|nr:aldehyde dehydrogenase family protein [Candidatus Berkiella sp.]